MGGASPKRTQAPLQTTMRPPYESKKPWEVVVGQAIGGLTCEDLASSNMLIDFLGAEMVSDVIFRNAG